MTGSRFSLLSLYHSDSLRYCATEQLSSSDYTCQYCGQLSRATKQLSLSRLPPVLCIQLKVSILFHSSVSIHILSLIAAFLLYLNVNSFSRDSNITLQQPRSTLKFDSHKDWMSENSVRMQFDMRTSESEMVEAGKKL